MTDPVSAQGSPPSFIERRGVRLAFGVVIAAIAWLTLHALAREVTWAALVVALAATSPADVAVALAFTGLSFCALALYDVIAVRIAAPGRIPPSIAAMTGAASYAVSNMLGFSLVTGGAIRARIYGRHGLDAPAIVSVLGTSWITFWLGVFVATGTALLIDPAGPLARLGLSPLADRAAGAMLLAAVAAAFAWIGSGTRRLRWQSHVLMLPTLRLSLAQTAVALVDIGAAAMALWFLLPAGVEIGPATFFVAYVAAIVVGIVSHSPGGLGAFEATLMLLLGLGGQPDVLASLLLYRLVYYALPFVLTTLGIALLSWRANRDGVSQHVVALGAWTEPLIPPLAGTVAIAAGTVLLVSGALPAIGPREAALAQLAPLGVMESSHLVGSALGVVLIVLARGLLRREARAWTLTLAALTLGGLASLLKGLDWVEAGLLVSGAGVLIVFRDAFFRRGAALRLTASWLTGTALLLGGSIWLGLLAYRHVDYADDLWWRFAWNGDASRFLRGSVAAAVTLACVGLWSLLRRTPPEDAAEPIPDAVRAVVANVADPEAAMALLGDKRFLLAPGGDAFVMYRTTRAAMVAMGDPVGDPAAGRALAWDFLERADRAGLIPGFYAVGTNHLPTYLDMGLSILKIGEVARVDLSSFTLEGKARKDMRYACARATRDGLTFEVVPAAGVPDLIGQLRTVSDAWLDGKAGAEKSFALGNFDPTYLVNFPTAVMRDAEGRIRAFANLLAGDGRTKLSLDLMRYDPEAPAVTMQALFVEMIVWGQAQGYRWFGLGAAPFSGMSDHRLATRWNRMGAYLFAHGDRFYHFEGLRAFKEKFDPVWTPHYLACPNGLAAGRVLIEVNRLVSGGVKGLLD